MKLSPHLPSFPTHRPCFPIAESKGTELGCSQIPSKLPASVPDAQLGCRRRSEAASPLLLLGAGSLPAGSGEEPR